jgi:aminoglycoside 6-adenylyltransferase
MLEIHLRNMIMKMIAWHVGTETDFSVNLDKCHKFLRNYLSPIMWQRIIKTYPDTDNFNIWHSLFKVTPISQELTIEVANKTGLNYNLNEAKNVMEYLESNCNKLKE